MSNIGIATARAQKVFVTLEPSRGELTWPAATDLVACTGYPDINQPRTYSDSEEIVDSRDVMARFTDKVGAGQVSLSMYARPNGLGVSPQGSALIECLLGKRTVYAGAKVDYEQIVRGKPTCTIWAKQDHTVRFARGVVLSSCKPSLSNKGALKLDFSASCMQVGHAGTSKLTAGALEAATEITVADGRLYTVGARVWNSTKSDDNTGAGYEITAIDGNDLTLAAGLAAAWDLNDVIEGYLPAGTMASKEPIENRYLVVSIGGVNARLKSLDATIDDPIKVIDDEISDDEFPADFVEDARNVSGSIGMYFRAADLAMFADAAAGAEKEIKITVGNTPGQIVEILMPRCSLEVPKVQVNAPTIDLSIGFKALGTNGEDSCKFTFK